METEVYKFLLSVLAAAGGGAVVSYTLIVKFGEAWMNAKFSQTLEAFRHEKAKDLAHWNAEVEGVLRAKERYSARQFEASQAVWGAIKEMQARVGDLVSPFQQYDDVGSMDENTLNEILDERGFRPFQKREVLSSSDRQKSFIKICNVLKFSRAAEAFNSANSVVRANEIFMDAPVFNLAREILDAMHEALVEKEHTLEGEGSGFGRESWDAYNKRANPAISRFAEELRRMVTTLEVA